MPRRFQIGSGGFIFHVLNRGAFQTRLFSQKADYQAFINVLREALDRFPIRLLAFCIMPTHFHLVLCPLDDQALSRFMFWMTTVHAQRWRRARETAGQGAVYQGRYKAIPVQNDCHLLVLLWYVERNPVRAGLVSRAEEWRWSSATEHGGKCNGLSVAPWPILRPCDWLGLLNSGEPPSGIEAIRLAIVRGQPFGDERWQRETAVRLRLEHTLRGQGQRGMSIFPENPQGCTDQTSPVGLVFDPTEGQSGNTLLVG